MTTINGSAGDEANCAAGQTVRESQDGDGDGSSTDQSDSNETLWFPDMARSLLGKDAGYALHLITGRPERTCYRYASGERKVSAAILIALLRSQYGFLVLKYITRDARPDWLLNVEHAVALGAILQRTIEEAKKL